MYNDRVKDIILDVVLPKEIIYKEDKGTGELARLRHGVLDDEMIYQNRKVINTRNGQYETLPRVVIYFRAFTDSDSVIIIDIFDHESKNLLKKFTIKSSNNDFSISDMKTLIEEIKTLIQNDDENKVITLIELIRNKDNLIYEEVAQ